MHRRKRRVLFDEEHAGARGASREEIREVPWHRSDVMRDENTGVRQEADHRLPRMKLAARALQLFLHVSGSGIHVADRVLLALTPREILVYFSPVSEIKGNRAVHCSSVNVGNAERIASGN